MSALQNRLQKLSPAYIVDIATDGQAGWKFVETVAYELILLDVMLPKLDGISFAGSYAPRAIACQFYC